MKCIRIALGVGAIALLAGTAVAQTYDKQAEVTIAGVVRHVLTASNAEGVIGVHLEVITPTGSVRVAVAPSPFIANNNFYFFTDEQVVVVGAKMGANGEVWARALTKDGKTFLVLRDEDGTPRWPRATDDDPDGCGIAHAPIR